MLELIGMSFGPRYLWLG